MGQADRMHVLLNGALGCLDPELQEFALDALRAPEEVLLPQLLDEVNRYSPSL